jgi:predicted Fe-Mo cluster-binding NifX family protein/predicted DNA-binding protein (UPF0251 family)
VHFSPIVPVVRPPKWRRCERWEGGSSLVAPVGPAVCDLEQLQLGLPELETLRLLHVEGLTQEQAASSLGVSRSTVSRMAENAHRVVTLALVEGKALHIGGGPAVTRRSLVERAHSQDASSLEKGTTMVVAVPYADGQVNQHFGATQAFLISKAEGEEVVEASVYELQGLQHNHQGIAGFLKDQGVEAILAGGMGHPMQEALKAAGFLLYCGVSGDAVTAVEAFLRGEIEQSEATCGHHHGEAQESAQ